MARQVAHEIKNPLTPISLTLGLLKRSRDENSPDFDSILDRTIDVIQRQVENMREVVRDFTALAGVPHTLATVNVHAYRLALIDPDGTTVEHYTHKIRADGGSHQGVIHLSFNENPGAWKLNVTDINTGVVGMATFNVRVIR